MLGNIGDLFVKGQKRPFVTSVGAIGLLYNV